MDDKDLCKLQKEITHERELREQWQEAHERFHTLDKEALILARREIDRRLEEMNQFRAQIVQERGMFVSREFYDEQHRRLNGAIEAAKEAVDVRLKMLETSKSNLEGRMWMMGAAISAVVVLVNLAMRYLGK